MSEEVLHNYLSRAVTQTEFLAGPETSNDGVYGTEDDERMLLSSRGRNYYRAVDLFVGGMRSFSSMMRGSPTPGRGSSGCTVRIPT